MDRPDSVTSIDFTRIRKILIVRLGKIGDIVVTSFTFEVLKNSYPHLEIHLFTLDSNRSVVKYNPRINKVIYTKKNISLYLKIFSLRKEQYDMILDFNDNASTTSAFIFKYVTAGIKASYDFDKYKRYINFKITPLRKDKSHIIERMQNFLSQLGLVFDKNLVKPYFYIGSGELQEVTDEIKLRIKDENIIAINLSAGAKIRYWGIDKWIELFRSIDVEYNNFFFIFLSTNNDSLMRQQLVDLMKSSNYMIGSHTSIQHFAAYIKSAKLLITPDTSAVHIASAFGVPTIALYPNPEWNYISWQPYGVAHQSIRSSSEHVNDISVEKVFTKFKSLINEIGLT